MLSLLCVGAILVASAGLRANADTATSVGGLLGARSTTFAILACACLAVGAMIPWERLLRVSMGWGRRLGGEYGLIALAALAASLAYVPGLGRTVNGSQRWVDLGWFSFQPSEVAKWILPVGLALYAVHHGRDAMRRFRSGFLVPFGLLGLVCLLVAAEDLGTGVLMALVGTLTLVAGGTRVWHVAAMVPVGLLAIVGLVVTSPYRVNRILAYLDPYADPQGIGYHIIQSMGAINGGGLLGRGIGEGIQKYGYLPEATTDFIFSVAAEELGMAGALLIVFLFAWLTWSGVAVVANASPAPGTPDTAESRFLRLAATGIIATITLQAIINLLVVTGLAPTKGIALPLISRGGTGWMMTALSLGLLVRLDRIGGRLVSGPTLGELRDTEEEGVASEARPTAA